MSHTKRTYILHTVHYSGAARYCSISKYSQHELLLKIKQCYNKPTDILMNYNTDKSDYQNTGSGYMQSFSMNYYFYVSKGDRILTKDHLVKLVSSEKSNSDSKRQRHYQTIHNYRFRYEPVPYVHHHHFGNYYRLPQLGYMRRANCKSRVNDGLDELNIEYYYNKCISNKYHWKKMPEWDDKPRHLDRSWKTSYKCRHQWEKHCF